MGRTFEVWRDGPLVVYGALSGRIFGGGFKNDVGRQRRVQGPRRRRIRGGAREWAGLDERPCGLKGPLGAKTIILKGRARLLKECKVAIASLEGVPQVNPLVPLCLCIPSRDSKDVGIRIDRLFGDGEHIPAGNPSGRRRCGYGKLQLVSCENPHDSGLVARFVYTCLRVEAF